MAGRLGEELLSDICSTRNVSDALRRSPARKSTGANSTLATPEAGGADLEHQQRARKKQGEAWGHLPCPPSRSSVRYMALQGDQGSVLFRWTKRGAIMWCLPMGPKSRAQGLESSWGMLRTCPGVERDLKSILTSRHCPPARPVPPQGLPTRPSPPSPSLMRHSDPPQPTRHQLLMETAKPLFLKDFCLGLHSGVFSCRKLSQSAGELRHPFVFCLSPSSMIPSLFPEFLLLLLSWGKASQLYLSFCFIWAFPWRPLMMVQDPIVIS